jgi:branched-chain amino acid transport system substrate-binding protein
MKTKALLTLVVSVCLVSISVLPFMAGCKTTPTTGEPIILGAPLSIGHPDGVCARDNLQLAVDEINAAGGVDVGGVMRPFQLVVIDSRDLEPGVPTSESLLAVEKLILEDGANFIIGGPIRSEAALAAMDIVSQYKIVSLVSAGVLTPTYRSTVAGDYDKYKYCFRTTGISTEQVTEILSLLDSLKTTYGFDKAFFMMQDVAFATAAHNALKPALEQAGWTIVGDEKYPTGTTDFSIGLLEARDAGAQVLIPWGDMPEFSVLVKQYYDMQLPALIVSGMLVAVNDPGAWEALDGKCAYIVACHPRAGEAASDAIPLAQNYINAYEEKFGTEPALTWVGPVSYQVVYILKDAIERAGSIDSDAVITALEETDMMGIYGRIRFDPQNHDLIDSLDPAEGAVSTWMQWIDGERVPVYPPVVATDTIKLPPWME